MNLQSEFMRPKKGFGPALLSFQHLKIQPGSWVKRGRRVKELAGDEAEQPQSCSAERSSAFRSCNDMTMLPKFA
jgi:hypothetical protein